MEERVERGKGHIESNCPLGKSCIATNSKAGGLKHRKEIGNGLLTKLGWNSQHAVGWEGRCLGSPEYILRYPGVRRLWQSDECSY